MGGAFAYLIVWPVPNAQSVFSESSCIQWHVPLLNVHFSLYLEQRLYASSDLSRQSIAESQTYNQPKHNTKIFYSIVL